MISVTLTRAEVVAAGPCAEGLALFDAIAIDGVISVPEWLPVHTLWIAVGAPWAAGWLRDRNLIPGANLSDANLRGADLRGADLRDANLSDANLRGANRQPSDPPIAGWRSEPQACGCCAVLRAAEVTP